MGMSEEIFMLSAVGQIISHKDLYILSNQR